MWKVGGGLYFNTGMQMGKFSRKPFVHAQINGFQLNTCFLKTPLNVAQWEEKVW